MLGRLFEAALAGVDPEKLVERALGSARIRRALAGGGRIGIFAAGKAAAGMTRGALAKLGSRSCLAVVPKGHAAKGLPRNSVVLASHPEPDASSMRAARRALRFFKEFGEGDVLLCLISGGGSSLLALPRPGVTLAQKRRAVRELARSGASIVTLNRLRVSLSAVKGGRLGRATRARLVTLVLSDVPGDRADVVGSGPTVRGRRGDLTAVVGSNRTGLDAAAREARRLGIRVVLETRRLSGEARVAGRRLARRALALAPGTLLLGGGETVVALGSSHGRGGRTLELALSAAVELDGIGDVAMLSAGSDGRDGSSTAAGTFVDGTTIARTRRRGLDAAAILRRHDTHSLFARTGDLLRTGPTGTNVGDWVFVLRG
jgi:glycerate 2-kinase